MEDWQKQLLELRVAVKREFDAVLLRINNTEAKMERLGAELDAFKKALDIMQTSSSVTIVVCSTNKSIAYHRPNGQERERRWMRRMTEREMDRKLNEIMEHLRNIESMIKLLVHFGKRGEET